MTGNFVKKIIETETEKLIETIKNTSYNEIVKSLIDKDFSLLMTTARTHLTTYNNN